MIMCVRERNCLNKGWRERESVCVCVRECELMYVYERENVLE